MKHVLYNRLEAHTNRCSATAVGESSSLNGIALPILPDGASKQSMQSCSKAALGQQLTVPLSHPDPLRSYGSVLQSCQSSILAPANISSSVKPARRSKSSLSKVPNSVSQGLII
jgi:hypothetical protein